MNPNNLHTHAWTNGGPRAIRQDGRTLVHQRCALCWRDFAQGFDGVHSWEAVYIGVVRVERLTRGVTETWLNEKCPGRVPSEDESARAQRRN